MSNIKIPDTDSIAELAEFWVNHDLTDFEDQLEEVTESVFVRKKAIRIPLASKEMNAIRNIAKSKGIGSEELIREWVLEKIHA
ncbi:MAG: CopG family antitoxin [bacterium]